MPHYKCGTPANVHDVCRFKKYETVGGKWVEVMREGVVIDIQPGATTCNARVGFAAVDASGATAVLNTAIVYVTLGECEKAGLPVAAAVTASS
jgi:hypothetical protein